MRKARQRSPVGGVAQPPGGCCCSSTQSACTSDKCWQALIALPLLQLGAKLSRPWQVLASSDITFERPRHANSSGATHALQLRVFGLFAHCQERGLAKLGANVRLAVCCTPHSQEGAHARFLQLLYGKPCMRLFPKDSLDSCSAVHLRPRGHGSGPGPMVPWPCASTRMSVRTALLAVGPSPSKRLSRE